MSFGCIACATLVRYEALLLLIPLSTMYFLKFKDKKQQVLTRDSKGCFINSTWLQTQLAPVINDTNKTLGWNFKLSKFEDLQYTSYDKSQHYSWHTDTHAKPYADGMVRKISFSLILNDEFEGGDFAICEPHPEHTKSIIHRFEKTLVLPESISADYLNKKNKNSSTKKRKDS